VRIPVCWDSFETAVGVIVGQVVNAASAGRTLEKLVRKPGSPRTFPSAATLACADLTGLGL
jgi:3-methyladenine DNA glycosylase/8-oxoguanine DNA glycosylase